MILAVMAALVAGMVLTSCIYDYDTCDDVVTRRIKVEFDWDRAQLIRPEWPSIFSQSGRAPYGVLILLQIKADS